MKISLESQQGSCGEARGGDGRIGSYDKVATSQGAAQDSERKIAKISSRIASSGDVLYLGVLVAR